ncbi:MAG: ABC transporter, permease protein 1 (cluster 1, maltose/g3p/polyamine/iron) [uncultured Thermomicrobiales bacterium]|uniref:ABC transporter, permease protein 1 (Cluster 1, maltose/g3p/polyamine/iron) n=1 Tax=uncultured Thermomicrobiales bacterium TaxID=1645740 RepID=A0A6J4V5C7_9BACT|nr:MAG: ABC transporter, permease protein 1 (cluster 1, maltose/g3p/polyamine/iron) [uncultured Thermomicrobiales bacterium]
MAVAVDRVLTQPGRRPRIVRAQRRAAGFLFVLPAAAFIGVFFLVPLGLAAWVSLHDWPLFGATSFTGFDNFMALVRDGAFWRSLWFTTRYALLVTPPIFLLGFALAMLANARAPGVGLFRTLFFLPNVVGFGAACLLWYFMLNDQYGVINAALRRVGVLEGSLLWLAKADTALAIIIAMVVWKTAGGTMLLLLIGMQAIPEDLYQAAAVDGAGPWERLRSITLPLLKRTFALALVLSITGSYLAFDQFFILTQGGPRNATTSIVQLITNTAFSSFEVGYATTMAFALLGVLIVLSSMQLFLLRDSTQY